MASWDFGAGMGGAMAGAQIGTSVLPGWGTAIGAGAGFILGGFMGGGGSLDKRQKRILNEQYLTLRDQRLRADEMYNMWKDTYWPMEQEYVAQVREGLYDPEKYANLAEADVVSQFNKIREAGLRRMHAYGGGRGPDSGYSAGEQRRMDIAQAKTGAHAQQEARFKVDELNKAAQAQAIQMGRGIPAQSIGYASGVASGLGNLASTYGAERDREDQALASTYGWLSENVPKYVDMYRSAQDPYRGGAGPAPGSYHAAQQVGTAFSFAEGGPVKNKMPMMAGPAVGTGGAVEGPGGPVDDAVEAQVPPNSYVIPADVVEALGVDFFDKLESSMGGQAGVEGAQSRVNALLSSGEYVVSPQVVQRKGKMFFDNLVSKHHKPAANQSEEYQENNKGAEAGEAMHSFNGGGKASPTGAYQDGGQAPGGYFNPSYDPMKRTQVGATPTMEAPPAAIEQPQVNRFQQLQQMWQAEQSGGPQMSPDELMEYNDLLDQQGRADGGMGYEKPTVQAADGFSFTPQKNPVTQAPQNLTSPGGYNIGKRFGVASAAVPRAIGGSAMPEPVSQKASQEKMPLFVPAKGGYTTAGNRISVVPPAFTPKPGPSIEDQARFKHFGEFSEAGDPASAKEARNAWIQEQYEKQGQQEEAARGNRKKLLGQSRIGCSISKHSSPRHLCRTIFPVLMVMVVR
jgi:hypothetical protein